MSNPADPWSFNYFDSPAPKAPPAATPKAPKLLPDVDRLFSLQRNVLKLLQNIQNLDDKLPDKHRLEHDASNAYRNIRGYLAEYANPEGS